MLVIAGNLRLGAQGTRRAYLGTTLVFAAEQTRWSTDFGEYRTGAAPNDWKAIADTWVSRSLDVIPGGLISDNCWSIQTTSPTSRSFGLVWSAVPDHEDSEVLMLVSRGPSSVNTNLHGALHRASGTNSSDLAGYVLGFRNNTSDVTSRIQKDGNLGTSVNTSHGATYGAGDAFWCRSRVSGTTLQVRAWPATATADRGLSNEPDIWLIETTASEINGEHGAGIFHRAWGNPTLAQSEVRVHYFGIGIGGDSAPAPGLRLPPAPNPDPDPTPDPVPDLDPAPDPDFGPELIANGDFSVEASGWQAGGWSISGGFAEHGPSAAASGLLQNLGASLIPGATYRVAWEQERIEAGKFLAIRLGDPAQTVETISNADTGPVEFFITPTAGGNSFRLSGGLTGHVRVSNFSIRQDLSVPVQEPPPPPEPDPDPADPLALPTTTLVRNPTWNTTPVDIITIDRDGDTPELWFGKLHPRHLFIHPISGKPSLLTITHRVPALGANPLNLSSQHQAEVWDTTDGVNWQRISQRPFFGALEFEWQGGRARPYAVIQDPRPAGNGRWLMYFGGSGEGWRAGNNQTIRQVGIAISTDNCQTWQMPSVPQITFTTAGINTWAPTLSGEGRRVYGRQVVYHDGWFYLRIDAGYSGNRQRSMIRSQDGVTNWQGWENFTSARPDENIFSGLVLEGGEYYAIRWESGWRLAKAPNPWGPWSWASNSTLTFNETWDTPALFRLGSGWAAVSSPSYAAGLGVRKTTMKLWYLN